MSQENVEIVRAALAAWEAWDTDAMAPITFIDAGDRVLVRLLWRGAGQGPESNMEFTVIYMLRKGMIVYQEHFWDQAEALEAVGLSEQDVSSA